MPDPVAPAAPVPAAPAAPAAPATPAPAAPPAAPPVAAPAAEPVAPVAPGEGAAPAAPVAPAAAVKPEPKAEEFGNDIEGFLKAHNDWEHEQSGEEPPPVDPAAEPPAAEPKPDTEEKPDADKPEQALEDDQPDLTPEALNNLIKETPELGELLQNNPKLNGAFQAMARVNAKAKPLLDIFPTVKAAEFANETANRFVGIRTAFQMAGEAPEKIGEAFDMLADEYKMVDAQGQPMKDAQGNIQYAPDFDLMINHVVDLYVDDQITELESRLQSNQYGNEDAKDNDSAALQAMKFVKLLKQQSPDAARKPDLSKLDPDTRAYFEQKDRELEEREKKLGDKSRQQTKEQRQQARATYETQFKQKFGGEVGKFAQNYVKQLTESGVHVPRYVLEAKDPASGASIFAVNVFTKFNKWFNSVPEYRMHAAELQMLPPTDENLGQRLQYFREIINENLPRFLKNEIRLIQGNEREDRTAAGDKRQQAERVATPEARGGAPVRPQMLTEEQAYAEAMKQIDAEGKASSELDRMEKALQRKNEILRGIRR